MSERVLKVYTNGDGSTYVVCFDPLPDSCKHKFRVSKEFYERNQRETDRRAREQGLL